MYGKCNHCHEETQITRLLEVTSSIIHGINVLKVHKLVNDKLCYDCIEIICDQIAQTSLNKGT